MHIVSPGYIEVHPFAISFPVVYEVDKQVAVHVVRKGGDLYLIYIHISFIISGTVDSRQVITGFQLDCVVGSAV